MKPNALTLYALVLAVPLPSPRSLATVPPAVPEVKSLNGLLDRVRDRTSMPGLAAAAIKDGRIVGLGVGGARELGKPEAIEAKDRFVIGSCTKAMTRMLFARLVQAGKLSYDWPLAKALPGVAMRKEYQAATIGDLMRHTSGLQPYTRITPKETPIIFELKGNPRDNRRAFAAHVLMEAPAGQVGKDFVYSNAGYLVLGAIAEAAGGKPWEDLMEQEVFRPLGLASAVIGLPAARTKGPMPTGHLRGPGGFEVAKYGPPLEGLFAPAGGVVLAIEDFAKFAMAEAEMEAGLANAYLGQGAISQLPALRPADAGEAEGAIFFGGQGSFTAAFAVWPSQRFAVVVCCNGGDSDELCEAAVNAIRSDCAPGIPPSAGPRPRARAPAGRKLGIGLRMEPGGVLRIAGVAAGSLADQAGLKSQDQISLINGKTPDSLGQDAVMTALGAPALKLVILRDGKSHQVDIP